MLIHLSSYEAWEELRNLPDRDPQFRKLVERQMIAPEKGGGTRADAFVPGGVTDTLLVPRQLRHAVRALLFAGQGSQRRGMGAEVFDAFPDHCALADDILGHSVRDLCLRDDGDRLRLTRYAQPALFTVHALTYLAQRAERGEPDVVAGHSLGELNALMVAGVMDFATGLRLVAERGRLMGEAAPWPPSSAPASPRWNGSSPTPAVRTSRSPTTTRRRRW
ncbi:hypothetical protein SHIRM173S_10203 [Streptomyces hirsutus]